MAKKIVISFGRMNPITIGHEVLVNKIVATAKARNAIARLYLSHTQSAKKDPLSYSDKLSFARAAFGKIVTKSSAKTLIDVMKSLHKEKFTDVAVIAGSDRVAEFETLLNKYNDKEYSFDNIAVISAGERDPDAEGVVGMSGSKMRALATSGKQKEFMAGAASKMPALVKRKMYKAVIAGLNESITIDEATLSLYRYDKITGYWKWERGVTPETKDQWLSIFTKDSPKDHFVVSLRKPKGNPMKEHLDYDINEEFENLFEADVEGDDDINVTAADAAKVLDGMDHDDLDPHEHDAYFLHLLGPEYLDADDEDAEDDEVEDMDEARLAMPIKGHAYHTKSDAELRYIVKDAGEAAKANRGGHAENKYLDQVNDASTVLYYRSKGGKRIVKEDIEIDTVDEAVATLAQRMKMSMRMRRLAKRYAMIRKLKAKRMAPADRLRYRSRKAALMAIRRRILGKNKTYAELSKQQRISLDQQIARRFGNKLGARIDMISKRLLPAVRKKEMERVAQARSATPQNNEAALDKSHLHLTDAGETKKKHIRVFEELFAEARKSASVDQGAEGDLNIIYQLRKVQRLGANFKVTWTDGTKSAVSIAHAVKAQDMYKKLMSAPGVSGAQKQRFVRKLGKSDDSFHSTIKEEVELDEAKSNPAMIRAKLIAKMAKHSPSMNAAMKDAHHLTKLDTAIKSGPKKEEVEVDESFSDSHIDTLKAVYSKINTVDPSSAAYKKLIAMLDKMDKSKLQKLAGADIKFVSSLARNRVNRMKEDVTEAHDDDVGSKLTPKVDMLLRLGLVDADSINSYRTALRGGEKSLTNPALRQKLMDLLDRLLNLSTKDPQTFNRLRTTVREDAMADKQDSEQDALAIRHAREKAMAKARAVIAKTVKKEIKDEVQLSDKAWNNLNEKALKHNIDSDIVMEVYARGLNAWDESPQKITRDQWAFNRVNSFLSGGAARATDDADLWEQVSGAGEFGTDGLRKKYSKDTPGQQEDILVSSFSARKPWVTSTEENVDTGKSPKTYQDIRKAISGMRGE